MTFPLVYTMVLFAASNVLLLTLTVQFLELSFSYKKRRYRFSAHPSCICDASCCVSSGYIYAAALTQHPAHRQFAERLACERR
jgi:hypothetical protein